VLRIQVPELPVQLNPLASSDLWAHRIALHNLFEPLVLPNPSGAFRPHLALRLEISAAGRLYTFKLRPNVRFHDGKPLTSEDVKATIENLVARTGPSELLRLELGDVLEVKAPDEETVTLLLRQPNHLLLGVLSEVGILPAHVYGRSHLRDPRPGTIPVGTGPFKVLVPHDRTTVTLHRNDDYWGARSKLDSIVFVAFPEPARAFSALRDGEVDILPSLHPSYYPEQVETDRMKQKFQLYRLHPYKLRILLYNLRRPTFKERRVRLAVAHLVDREHLVRSQRNDLGQVSSVPLWTLSSWYDHMLHPLAYDRKAAARLLDAAGYRDPNDKGMRRRLGSPLRFTVLWSRESGETGEIATMLRQELRGSGLEAEFEAADFGFIRTVLLRGKFDAALVGLAPRPDTDLSLYLHSKGALNYGAYSSPVVDNLLEVLRSTSSPEARQRIGRQLHRALQEDPPYAVLFAPIDAMLVNRRVHGLANNGRWPKLVGLTATP
jgi:peptide/nickel transport system substrate-binding protein